MIKDLVEIQNKEAVTTFRKIAKVFGKRHDHLMRDIRNILVAN